MFENCKKKLRDFFFCIDFCCFPLLFCHILLHVLAIQGVTICQGVTHCILIEKCNRKRLKFNFWAGNIKSIFEGNEFS